MRQMSRNAIRPRLRLRVTASAESIVRSDHPWLFADSIREQNREGEIGELAVIYDRRDNFLGIGLYDSISPIRVRILHVGKPKAIDRKWWSGHLEHPLGRRRGLFDELSTGYRWINGESDGWPGLVLDRYDTTLVLKLYTAAWLPRLSEISALICQSLHPERMVLRLSRNIQKFAIEQFAKRDGQLLHGAALEGPIIFLESRLSFEADVVKGQKTGFFLDQRENRRKVRALAKGRTVLNAFSFTGGFSVYAADGGANSVTDLDISSHALAGCKSNLALNRCPSIRHETIKADAFEWLAENGKRKFDMVILDPPSLAKREDERARAVVAYARLASLGIRHLAQDGILLACSCSAHVSAEEFFEAVRNAGKESKRKFRELETTGHAPDHPATFQEAEYLKAIYLAFQPAA